MINIILLARFINKQSYKPAMDAEKIDLYDALSLILSAVDGRPNGKAVLQGLIYFCCRSVANIESVRFEPSYNGPYSERAIDVMYRMTSCGFLEHVTIRSSSYRIDYYELTKSGEHLAEDAKKLHGDDYSAICNIIDKCYAAIESPSAGPEAAEFREKKLLRIAKVHYLLRKFQTDSPDKISEYAKGYGWNMDSALVSGHLPLAMEFNECYAQTPDPWD
ncbi:hypothetical protein CENSYa_2030 [Cenarchaeum symbiosum A]|uniref:Antitoxin SocA-like Panacea domain-containing protein n=1 Tax=Cenarchaeum symbiosum (strain A) TaxID=414004 RepID=A0RZ66_CENSY|nr:hypothetical protein CENSYa_2030 [Cenarchaeum symbiosum A]